MHRAIATVLLSLLPHLAFSSEIRVLATIKPVHALVAGVMSGIGSPELLTSSSASPHDYSLSPSQMRSIVNADVVFWVGPTLESFIAKPLVNAREVRSEELLKAPGVRLLPVRVKGIDGERGASVSPQESPTVALDDADGHGHDGPADPHIWLDPWNAVAMVRRISEVLGELEPARRLVFQRNASALIARLEVLDARTRVELDPIKSMPYLVFHDAYQYYEKRYDLNVVGAIVPSAEKRPGARRLREIRDLVRTAGVRCVFAEPQFQSALVETVIEGTGARVAVLDPLGAELEPGPESYFTLVGSLTRALRECLQS